LRCPQELVNGKFKAKIGDEDGDGDKWNKQKKKFGKLLFFCLDK
jgi:hypothetical protein